MSNFPSSSTSIKKKDRSPSFGDIDVNKNSSKAALALLLKEESGVISHNCASSISRQLQWQEDKKHFHDLCQKSKQMEMINQLNRICKEESKPFQLHSNLPSQLLVNTPSTLYISPKGATTAGAATSKVVKPLPAAFSSSFFCFALPRRNF